MTMYMYAFVYLIFLLGYITGFYAYICICMHAHIVIVIAQCIIQYIHVHVCSLIHCVGDV